MKKLLCVLAAFPSTAFAVDYDINKYCRKMGNDSGGSAQIEVMCRDMEIQSKANILSMNPPTKVMNYCTKAIKPMGGGYNLLELCIEQEMEARSRLNK